MSAQTNRTGNDFVQAAAGFGRARARCKRSLDRLAMSQKAFVDAHGARASIDDLDAVLPGLQQRVQELCDMKVTAAAVARAYRLASDIRQTVVESPVAGDMHSEAEEESDNAVAAGTIIADLQELARANDALLSACEAFGDDFEDHEGEETMANTASMKAPALRPGGMFRSAPGKVPQVRANTVASQLIASLDRLGLPHREGTLDAGDETDGRLTEQLIRALRDGYETYPTETGIAVRRRIRPTGGFRTKSAALAGRVAVDAQAIAFAAEQLSATLDGIDSQLRFVERPGLPGGAPLTRQLVERRLDEIRALAASPQGIPVGQATIKSEQLAREAIEYLSAIGVEIDTSAERLCGDDAEPFGADAVTLSQSGVVREELRSEVVEVGRLVHTIHNRLRRAATFRSDAEVGYRLERTLERAVLTARATLDKLASVDMADTLNLWESIDLCVPDSAESLESLGNGLADSLVWLINVATPFAERDRAAQDYGRMAMAGLASELTTIAGVLAACAETLSEFELDGTASDVAENTAGLAVIARKCAGFANRLGS